MNMIIRSSIEHTQRHADTSKRIGHADRIRAICVIPVKRLDRAKSRLSPAMASPMRADLQLTMLCDVLTALSSSPSVDHIIVVSRDRKVGESVRSFGAKILNNGDADGSMDAAVEAGIICARDLAAACPRARHQPILFVPADIPCINPDEVEFLLERAIKRDLVQIVPDRLGKGTNAICMPKALSDFANFGPGSFAHHLSSTPFVEYGVESLHLKSFARDVDCEDDLKALASCAVAAFPSGTASGTRRWLQEKAPLALVGEMPISMDTNANG